MHLSISASFLATVIPTLLPRFAGFTITGYPNFLISDNIFLESTKYSES